MISGYSASYKAEQIMTTGLADGHDFKIRYISSRFAQLLVMIFLLSPVHHDCKHQ